MAFMQKSIHHKRRGIVDVKNKMPRLSPRQFCLLNAHRFRLITHYFSASNYLIDAEDLTQDSRGSGAPTVTAVSRSLTIPGVIPAYEPFTKSLARSTLVIT